MRLKDEKGSEAFFLDRAVSNSSTTMLSFPSIQNGVSPVQSSVAFHSFPFFLEYARAAQYHTFLISSLTFQWYNFETYFNTPDINYRWNREISGLPPVNDLGVDYAKTTQAFIDHIKTLSQSKARFAGILHYNTNHYPYNTPKEFKKWGPERIDLYDNTILFQDYLIKRVFESLDSLNKLDNTVVVFTSDHGEAFKEHGFIGHRDFYYIEVLRIPMFVFIPEALQSSVDIDVLRSNENVNTCNLDILPTLLELMGIADKPEVAAIRKNMLGSSLFSPIDEERPIIVCNNNEIARYREGLSVLRGNKHYLMQINTVPKREELYDFINDPLERNNLWTHMNDSAKSYFIDPFNEFSVCQKIFQIYWSEAK